ncbi:MAG: hypothetical protein HY549_02335 [Elusimicrobia bacterium]|nr:hypothetical protein [Elusimicrobiota bacterium]
MSNSLVVKLLLASMLGLGVIELAGAQRLVDFDQGVDASTLLKEATEGTMDEQTLPQARVAWRQRYERDCVKIAFAPDSPPVSQPVRLHSREWIEDCRWVPGGRNQPGRWECWERPGMGYSETVQITLRDRKPLLPWEHDGFLACLEGPWTDWQALETAYEYKQASSRGEGSIVLAPGRKLAMKPDPTGIRVESFSRALKLALSDRWSSYYAGEVTRLTLKLKRQVKPWPDPVLLEKELDLEPAPSYEIDFLAYRGQFSEPLKPGEKYYVEIEFSRRGRVSKEQKIEIDETPAVPYQPVSVAAAR